MARRRRRERRPRPPRRPPQGLPEAPDLFGFDDEPAAPVFADEEIRVRDQRRPDEVSPAPGPEAPGRRLSGETVRRLLFAIPWIVFAIVITVTGGLLFAAAMAALGIIGLREFCEMTRRHRPIAVATYIALIAMIAAAYFGTSFNVLLILAAAFPLLFFFAAQRSEREGITVSIALTLLALVWIGVPLVHAVLLRELPLHGAALLIDVLVGTFVTDTAAYACGRMFGTHKIAPNLSPNKTVEGMVGGFLIGTLGFWFAGLYQDWLSGTDALIMGAAVAAIAPIGDLFESMVKRDLGVKDSGTIFGPHGGLLDRLDAVFFTIVAGYYLSVAFVY